MLKGKILSQINALNLHVQVALDYMKDDLGEPMMYKPHLLDEHLPHIDSLGKVFLEQEGFINYGLSICVGDFNHFTREGIPT